MSPPLETAEVVEAGGGGRLVDGWALMEPLIGFGNSFVGEEVAEPAVLPVGSSTLIVAANPVWSE